jgi:hypothetical protein
VSIKSCILLLLIACIGAGTWTFASRRVVLYHDDIVTAGELRSPSDALAVHLGRTSYLTVGAKTFYHLRGLAPFHLRVPEINAVLFVTRDRTGEGSLHLYMMTNHLHLTFEGPVDSFGEGICSPGGPAAFPPDAAAIDGPELVLKTYGFKWSEVLYANVLTKKIVKTVSTYYDESGCVVKVDVQKPR